MFEYLGREDGERDGNADACDGLSKHPRPDLKTSLISNGYRDSYFAAYHGAFDLQSRVQRQLEYQERLNRQRTEKLKRHRQQIPKSSQDDQSQEI